MLVTGLTRPLAAKPTVTVVSRVLQNAGAISLTVPVEARSNVLRHLPASSAERQADHAGQAGRDGHAHPDAGSVGTALRHPLRHPVAAAGGCLVRAKGLRPVQEARAGRAVRGPRGPAGRQAAAESNL